MQTSNFLVLFVRALCINKPTKFKLLTEPWSVQNLKSLWHLLRNLSRNKRIKYLSKYVSRKKEFWKDIVCSDSFVHSQQALKIFYAHAQLYDLYSAKNLRYFCVSSKYAEHKRNIFKGALSIQSKKIILTPSMCKWWISEYQGKPLQKLYNIRCSYKWTIQIGLNDVKYSGS